MHSTLQQIYYRPHLAADVISSVLACVHSANNRVYLRKWARPLKLFSAFDLLDSLANDILELLHNSRWGYQYIILIAVKFTILVQVVILRRIRSVYVAQEFSEHWVYNYGPPKSLLSDNIKQFKSKFLQIICPLFKITYVITSIHHP